MQESLTRLIESGRRAGLEADSAIHYPADGHLRLASVEETHFWFTQRRELVLKLIRRHHRGERTPVGIDVGCGSGFTAVWLTEHGVPTYGQDVYEGFRDLERQGRGIGFLQGDVRKLDPVAEFDFALLLDVIEHVEGDGGFVDHVGKMIKPGGFLILTVPAFTWLWSSVDDASGHLRRYVKRDLAAFESLPVTRFRIELSSYYYGSTLPIYFLSRMALRLRGGSRSESSAELAPAPLVNSLLEKLLRAEASLCAAGAVPVGSSLVAVLRKLGDSRTGHPETT